MSSFGKADVFMDDRNQDQNALLVGIVHLFDGLKVLGVSSSGSPGTQQYDNILGVWVLCKPPSVG